MMPAMPAVEAMTAVEVSMAYTAESEDEAGAWIVIVIIVVAVDVRLFRHVAADALAVLDPAAAVIYLLSLWLGVVLRRRERCCHC